MDLDKVKTVILLMFENRSFDHMLGHMSLDKINVNVDGLRLPFTAYQNRYKGDGFKPYRMSGKTALSCDLPHEFDSIETQLSWNKVNKQFSMKGFVKSYAETTKTTPNRTCETMGFFPADQVPITSFLAKTFCVCDRWFSPLPTSTQPNRNMAFAGDSFKHSTHAGLVKIVHNIFDWMDAHEITWKLYHDGLSFFALYPKLWRHVLGSKFRDYEEFHRDMVDEPEDSSPQVIIIEPSYQDAPHIGSDRPNDNHAPLAIAWGEEFLRRTYQSVIANPQKWESTVFIVYYDEHGGFYDHVPPPPMNYTTIGDEPHTFTSLGPRIPGIIISPLVESGSICHSQFDHTSVLQFLADKFTPGTSFSDSVEYRKEHGITSIEEALTKDTLWDAPQPPNVAISATTVLGESLLHAPGDDTMKLSFEVAADEMMAQNPELTKEKYPELLLWKEAKDQARNDNTLDRVLT
jgi:phospholipase C